MKVTKDITPEGEVTLGVEIPKDDIGTAFSDALKSFQTQAAISGFRPGKVPMTHIRQRWGKAIMMEKAEEIARQRIEDILKEQDLTPGGRIDIDLTDYGEDKPLCFRVTFPLQPEVTLDKYMGLEVTINGAEITDEDIDAQIEGIRHKHAMIRSIDTPAPADARLTLKVQEVDSSGLALIGRKVEEAILEIGTDMLGIGSDEQIIGIKAGEKRLIKTRTYSGAAVQTTPTIIKPGDEQGQSEQIETTFSVEAVKVEVMDLPEVDENLFALVNKELKTVEELKEHIKHNLMDYVASASRHELERKLIEKMIEENPFTIAPAVVNTTLENIADNLGFKEEHREAFYKEHFDQAEKDYRWVRLRDEIARVDGIKVEDEELNKAIAQLTEMSGDKAEEVQARYENVEERDSLRRRMLESKVIEMLAGSASVEKRKLSFKEFIRSAQNE